MHDEKRSAVRTHVSFDILINRDFLDPRRWRIRDVGMNSLFVMMAPEEMLPGSWVEVVLLFDDATETERLCLPAEIIRVSGDGVVLKYRDDDSHAGQMLRDFLKGNGDRRLAPSALHMSQI
jgi:hypothetical protein